MKLTHTSRDAALQVGAAYWRDVNGVCSAGTHQHPVLYMDGTCRSCLSEEINKTISMSAPRDALTAIAQGSAFYYTYQPCEHGPHQRLKSLRNNGRCYTCMNDNGRAATNPRAAARATGATWYTPIHTCAVCNTKADRRTADDRCSGCNPVARNIDPARAAARKVGSYKYTPTIPCSECGTYAERHTQAGTCTNCLSLKKRNPATRAAQLEKLAAVYAPKTSAQLAQLLGANYFTNEDDLICSVTTGFPL